MSNTIVATVAWPANTATPPPGWDRLTDTGGDELVDAVEHLRRQRDVRRRQVGLQLLHRARADDRRGDPGVVEHERDRQLDESQACFHWADQYMDSLRPPPSTTSFWPVT